MACRFKVQPAAAIFQFLYYRLLWGFERVLLGKCSTVFDELGNVDTEKDNGNDDS